MKKEVEVQEVVRKRIVTTHFCDICGEEYNRMYSSNSCSICERDVCGSCSVFVNLKSDDEEYPDVMCVICCGKDEFYGMLDDARDTFEAEKDRIFGEWKDNSLKEGNINGNLS